MLRVAALALFVCTLGASCGGGEPGTVKANPGRVFSPEEETVSVGDTVTWEVEGDEAHTVTAYEGELPEGADYFASGDFESENDATENVADGLLQGGETYEVTFDQPGTYRYYCIPHEADGMVGTIVVE
jgi:plastocyanin